MTQSKKESINQFPAKPSKGSWYLILLNEISRLKKKKSPSGCEAIFSDNNNYWKCNWLVFAVIFEGDQNWQMLVSVWFGLAACGFLKKRSSYWKIVLLHKIVHPKVNSDVDDDDNEDDNDGRRRIGQERNLVMSKLLQQQQRTQNLSLSSLTSTHSHIWKHTRTHTYFPHPHTHTHTDRLIIFFTHTQFFD